MSSVHPLQDPVIQRLNAHAYAVYPQFKKSMDISRTFLHYIFRIDLNRKFFVWKDVSGSKTRPLG